MESMKKNFQKKVLDNGMTILFEKRELPIVSVAFAVRAGGINEGLEEKGIFHFIEHMMYKGTEKRTSKDIANEIEKKGGELNGFTSEELTGYWCKMPSKHLSTALEVLGDVVSNPKFDEKEVEKERKVIFEEIKMRHDNPVAYSLDEIQKLMYTGTLGTDLIGTPETMNSINKEDLVEKFKSFYGPSNLVLCVVGNADFEKILEFANKNFKGDKNETSPQKFEEKESHKKENRQGIDQAHVVFSYHVPTSGKKGSYVARVLNCMMAEGMSSRLFSEIREKRNLAYGVKAGEDINKNFAYNFIYVGTMKENVEKVKNLILEEFEKVSRELKEEELREVKEQLVGNYQIEMEDSQTQMVNLCISEIQGDAEEFYRFKENIEKVSLEEVKEMALKVTNKNSSFTLVPA